MALLTLHQVTARFGAAPLLDGVDFQLQPGERVCLVGRNGTGKSTMLRILSGELEPDAGRVTRSQGVRVARLDQEVPEHLEGSVYDLVAEGLEELGPLLSEYHHVLEQLEKESNPALLRRLEQAQERLEAADGWSVDQRIETVLTRLRMDPRLDFSVLSGGQKRRVLLARALVSQPEVLLLDEPTNHLDVASIEWMEGFLSGWSGALLFVTHDRAFLQSLSTRILELDRGQLVSYPGDYPSFLEEREARLENERAQRETFDKKLAEEEAWIRRGVKARRARNEGRVRALEQLRRERRDRREVVGQARMRVQEAGKSGKLVLEARDVGVCYEGEPLFQGFSARVFRGDRIGVLGPNGCGKSTLLRVLLGEQAPDQGAVRAGSALEVAYFDQLRDQLEEERSVFDNVAGGDSHVVFEGRKKHVIGYLEDFLFTPDRSRQPVKALSGGERNRLLLARLFTRPANLLVMDEPTNDLDTETLELLEERLLAFPGTLLLVSHDRAFLDRVVTSCFAFSEGGGVREYVGGYSDWKKQDAVERAAAEVPRGADAAADAGAPAPVREPHERPLSYTEKKLLEKLPEKLEDLEAEKEDLLATLARPGFYQQPEPVIGKVHTRLREVEEEITEGYSRWEELEARREFSR